MTTTCRVDRIARIVELFGLTDAMEEYLGFDIVKKRPGLYWIIGCGSMVGSAKSVHDAKEFIDLLTETL